MSKNKILLIISLVLVVLPFIGFPKNIEDIVTVALGVILLVLALLYVRSARMGHIEGTITRTKSFLVEENGDVDAVMTQTDIEISNNNENNQNS